MTSHFSWSPSSPELQRISHDLLFGKHPWPGPAVDSPLVRATDRTSGRQAWEARLRGTYRTLSLALSLADDLLECRAPLDVLAGAVYTVDELHRHLALITHVLQPLSPDPSVDLPGPPRPPSATSHQSPWPDVVEHTALLFALNLPLSARIYEAIAAVTSDRSISRIAEAMAESLSEILRFGDAFLRWLADALPDDHLAAPAPHLPSWLLSTETLLHGSPEELDAIAGSDFTIEPRPGNLGVLPDRILAALFYDTLSAQVFPFLRILGWNPERAWREHYAAPLTEVTVAASGILHPT